MTTLLVSTFCLDAKLMPTQGSTLAAGWDLRAARDVLVNNYQVTKIPTGLHMAIPEGFYGDVRLRSGLAAAGLLLASSGIIDADYRGEIMVPAVAINDAIKIRVGDRIAQIIICSMPQVVICPVTTLEELGNTERGQGGFGSTGAR